MLDIITSVVVKAQNMAQRLRDEEEGQTMTEYALIIAVIALAVIVALIFLKDEIKQLFSDAGNSLDALPDS
jgi:Flp pilus assembly pilin Flp